MYQKCAYSGRTFSSASTGDEEGSLCWDRRNIQQEKQSKRKTYCIINPQETPHGHEPRSLLSGWTYVPFIVGAWRRLLRSLRRERRRNRGRCRRCRRQVFHVFFGVLTTHGVELVLDPESAFKSSLGWVREHDCHQREREQL